MRKLISLILVLMLIFGLAAAETQQPVMMELDFIDFTIIVPEDIIGSVEQQMANNVPFFMFFQDYDPDAAMNKNLSCVWTDQVLDIKSTDPGQYAGMTMAMAAMQYDKMGIPASDPMLYAVGPDQHDGREAFSLVYSLTLDYTGVGFDEKFPVYTMQAIVPIEGSGTYPFTLTTDDMQNIDLLMGIMNSISWKK